MAAEEPAPAPVYYMRPPAESHDAYRIWNDCCLPEISDQLNIYWALDNWARLNAIIEYREKGPFLTWWSPTRTKHAAYAETFARWFLCACGRPQIPTPALAPQPAPPDPPPQPLESLTSLTELTEDEENALDRPEVDLSDSEEEIAIHTDADKIDEKIDQIGLAEVMEEDTKQLLQADLEVFLNGWE